MLVLFSDIDFEYPTAAQASGFASLLSELRTGLNNLASSKGKRLLRNLYIPLILVGQRRFCPLPDQRCCTCWFRQLSELGRVINGRQLDHVCSRYDDDDYISVLTSSYDRWNLMAYDYAGSWSTVSDDQANLYRGATVENVDTDSSIKWYKAAGATASKINMGEYSLSHFVPPRWLTLLDRHSIVRTRVRSNQWH